MHDEQHWLGLHLLAPMQADEGRVRQVWSVPIDRLFPRPVRTVQGVIREQAVAEVLRQRQNVRRLHRETKFSSSHTRERLDTAPTEQRNDVRVQAMWVVGKEEISAMRALLLESPQPRSSS
jgi:hypothetical protein